MLGSVTASPNEDGPAESGGPFNAGLTNGDRGYLATLCFLACCFAVWPVAVALVADF